MLIVNHSYLYWKGVLRRLVSHELNVKQRLYMHNENQEKEEESKFKFKGFKSLVTK